MLPSLRLLLLVPLGLLSISIFAGAEERPLRIAIYADAGAGLTGIETVEAQLLADGQDVTRVPAAAIIEGILFTGFDVVMFTEGGGSSQGNALGEIGRKNVRQFVRDGGGYVGICAGAYLACTGFSWGVGVLDARTASPDWRRGEGTVKMEVTAAGEETSGIPAGIHEVRYVNGPILIPHGREEIPPYETVASFRTELADNNSPVGIMIDSPAIARSTFGNGRVVVSSPHPESTVGMEGTFAPAAARWAAGTSAARRLEPTQSEPKE